MAETRRKETKGRTFEVLVSFSGLNLGERFTTSDAEHADWADQHVETGYLRDVTQEPTVSEAQGSVAPVVPDDRVQEASNAGAVGKG